MKKIILSIAILCSIAFVTFAKPDEKYAKAIETALAQLKEAKTPEQIMAVANRFELIGKNAPNEWLPNYYAAYCHIIMSFTEKDLSKNDQLLEKAEGLITTLPENDEVYVLKAFSANASLAADPQNRWATYGPKFEEFLTLASKSNPENPRVYFLRGSMKYHTPQQFGGGSAAACPILQIAKTKYEAFKPALCISPTWGLDSTVEMMQSCK